jgi:gp6-like head-tail connector protein
MSTLQIVKPPAIEPILLTTMKSFLRVDQEMTDDDVLISGLITGARELVETFTNRSLITRQYNQTMDSFPYYTDTVMSQMAYPPSYYSLPRWSTTLWNYSQMIKLFVCPVYSVDRIAYLNDTDQMWHSLVPAIPKWFPGDNFVEGDQVRDGNNNIQTATNNGTSGNNPPAWNETVSGTTTDNPGDAQIVWRNDGPSTDDMFLADVESEPGRIFPGPAAGGTGQTFTWPGVLYEPNAVQIFFTAGYSTTVAGLAGNGRQGMITAMMQLVASWYENRETATPLSMREIPQHTQALLWAHCMMDMQPTRG